MQIVKTPMLIAYKSLPKFVMAEVIGSVAIKIEPKIKAPLKTCQKGLRYFSGFTSQKIKAVKKAELKTKIVILLSIYFFLIKKIAVNK